MSQYEIYNYLRDNPKKWFLAKELMNKFTLSRCAIVRILKCLENQEYIIKEPAVKFIKSKLRINKTTKIACA